MREVQLHNFVYTNILAIVESVFGVYVYIIVCCFSLFISAIAVLFDFSTALRKTASRKPSHIVMIPNCIVLY